MIYYILNKFSCFKELLFDKLRVFIKNKCNSTS